MDIIVRLLNIDTEKDLFIEAYRWRDTAPKWFKACLEIWKEPLEEYLDNALTELHYGVWNDEQFVAVVRLIQDRPGVYNIHLSAKKGIDWDVLLTAGCRLRDFLFQQGVVGFYGYLPTVNKGISKLYECLGFTDTGIRIFKGAIHGKVVEWKHYSLTAPAVVQ